MKRLLLLLSILYVSLNLSYGQSFGTCDCSATVGGFSSQTLVNFSSISWTNNTGTTTCPTSGSTSYTGNLCLTLGSKTTIVFDKTASFLVTGSFDVQNTGTSTIFSIPSGDGLHVTGNFGDPSNNTMDFAVNGTLRVDGTFYGKNSNAFSGSGSISGGSLNLGSSGTCSSPCPIANGSFGTCVATGNPNFCATYGVPVVLTSFGAIANSEGVLLSWLTASEINFDYFSLQRSRDGKSFNEIKQIPGHGTTNEANSYSYLDKDPIIGRSYYRLTSNDFDGYQETFKVVSVQFQGEKKFHVIPNPSDGVSVKLYFNFETDTDGVITIYDNVGSMVGTYPVGSEAIVFESILKTGVYLAKYSSASFTKTERFMVK